MPTREPATASLVTENEMSDAPARGAAVEIITDPEKVRAAEPLITVRTGLTDGQTFVIKINQPSGRALLVAVHL
jgi:hypothetical protein